MKIIVMAGTSDANQIIRDLKNRSMDIQIIATTVTATGALLARGSGADKVISKPLNSEELIEVIQKEKVDLLVDATHPYAVEATINAIKSSESENISYIRFERNKTILKSSNLIYHVSSFREGAELLSNLVGGKVFHLAGVSTIKYIMEFIKPERVVARVLPLTYSINKCQELGLPPENIIAMQGTYTKDFNLSMMKEYNVDAIITKDSGVSGGTPEKIGAALEMGIPVIMVDRPEIPELGKEIVLKSVEKLVEKILE
jgi:precorrin-6A/cobalt-precorrin-6A reductase